MLIGENTGHLGEVAGMTSTCAGEIWLAARRVRVDGSSGGISLMGASSTGTSTALLLVSCDISVCGSFSVTVRVEGGGKVIWTTWHSTDSGDQNLVNSYHHFILLLKGEAVNWQLYRGQQWLAVTWMYEVLIPYLLPVPAKALSFHLVAPKGMDSGASHIPVVDRLPVDTQCLCYTHNPTLLGMTTLSWWWYGNSEIRRKSSVLIYWHLEFRPQGLPASVSQSGLYNPPSHQI